MSGVLASSWTPAHSIEVKSMISRTLTTRKNPAIDVLLTGEKKLASFIPARRSRLAPPATSGQREVLRRSGRGVPHSKSVGVD